MKFFKVLILIYGQSLNDKYVESLTNFKALKLSLLLKTAFLALLFHKCALNWVFIRMF